MVLTAERWQRLKVLFSSIADLPPNLQSEAIARECGTDEELRREIVMLVEEDRRATGFVDRPAAAQLIVRDLAPLPPETIGRYRILSEIGHGGMGTVYLAEREGEYHQRVAIKVIRRGMNFDHVVRRFMRERQILANLKHPNIARLLDGGTTPDGLPYFVMEYVEGVPIDAFCRQRGLSLSARLELFLDVASAVHAAHQNLVVHRDIKPSNILVTSDGEPKLLDFGIAKLLDESGADDQTATEFRAMTPEYASPEQVLGLPLTTASDVYSLGVVLCEVLTGERPFRFDKRAPAEMLRVISESEPRRPSTLASHDGTVARSLRGDLDTIVLTTLRKDPVRRYASAEALASDIRRYLDQLPVRARPDTFRYRTAKFLRRNAVSTSAAALVLIALVGGSVATARQAIAARKAQQKAEGRFSEVRRLANSMLFELEPEIALLPGSTSVRQKLVATATGYLDSLSTETDDPGLKFEIATAYRKVAEVQGNPYSSNLGHPTEALRSYAESRRLLEALIATNPNDPAILESFAHTLVGEADVASQQLDLERAEKLYSRAIASFERVIPQVRENLEIQRVFAAAITKRGDLLGNPGTSNLGRPDEALLELQRGLALRRNLLKRYPTDDRLARDIAQSLMKIGYMLNVRGDTEEALALNRRALEVMEEVADRNPNSAIDLQDLSMAYLMTGLPLRDSGRLTESLGLIGESLAIMERLSARDPASALWRRNRSVIHNHLVQTNTDLGRFDEALRHAERSIALATELWDMDRENDDAGMDLVIAYRRSLDALVATYRFDQTAARARTTLQLLAGLNTEGNQRAVLERAIVESRLGRALAARGDRSTALAHLRHSRVAFEGLMNAGSDDALTKDELALVHYYEAVALGAGSSEDACRAMVSASEVWSMMREAGTLRWRSRDTASEAAQAAARCRS
ncbi:MAG TPA: serine/threonine-protein kinase [Thermoanaerobaculia bacterium]